MQQRLTPDSRQPKPEPEIYPPGATLPRDRVWVSTGAQDTQRLYVAPVGPAGRMLLALAIVAVAVLALFLILGAVAILAAVGVVVAAAIAISAGVRRRFWRLR